MGLEQWGTSEQYYKIRARRLRRRAVNSDIEKPGLSVFIFKKGHKRNGKK